MDSFQGWITEVQVRVEAALDRLLPPASVLPGRLHDAMRYAVLGGGKRVRPLLVFAAGLSLFSGVSWLTVIEKLGTWLENACLFVVRRWQERQDRRAGEQGFVGHGEAEEALLLLGGEAEPGDGGRWDLSGRLPATDDADALEFVATPGGSLRERLQTLGAEALMAALPGWSHACSMKDCATARLAGASKS